MPVTSETREAGPYTGNGSTTAFAFAFVVFSGSDLRVLLDGTELTYTTHYTVALNADQDNSPGGTVTMLTAPAAGKVLNIYSDVRPVQGVRLLNLGGFYPTVITRALDRITAVVQQLTVGLGISIRWATIVDAPNTLLGYGVRDEADTRYLVPAQAAQDAADDAQSTADGAVLAAAAAQSAANAAQSDADAAQGTANTSVSNAATAQAAAEAAQGTADTALESAATAQSAAESAQETADRANLPPGWALIWSGSAETVDIADTDTGDVPGSYLLECDGSYSIAAGPLAYRPGMPSDATAIAELGLSSAGVLATTRGHVTYDGVFSMRFVTTNLTTGATAYTVEPLTAIYILATAQE
jgi:hypothetical protein